MFDSLLEIIFLFSLGILLIFCVGVWLDFKMKRSNKTERESALKKQSDEAGVEDPRN